MHSEQAHSITLVYIDFGCHLLDSLGSFLKRIPDYVSSERTFVNLHLEAVKGPQLGLLVSDS